MEALAELRKHVQGNKLVMGTAEVIRLLKQGKLAEVFSANNCSVEVKGNLERLCEASGCQITELPVPNDELGVLCKKPFSIAVVGVLK